jgi:hypothetical protein
MHRSTTAKDTTSPSPGELITNAKKDTVLLEIASLTEMLQFDVAILTTDNDKNKEAKWGRQNSKT